MISNELKEELEKQLSDFFSKDLKIQKLKPVSGGCINETIKLETNFENFFLKVNSSKKFPGMFETEANGLQLLSNTNTIKIPSVILFGEYKDTSFLILEWIEQGRRRTDFFEDFGRKLARLHKHS